MQRFIYFIKSLKMNYKSWIVIYISILLVDPKNAILAIFLMYLYFYIFHYVSHCDYFYPLNCIHSYHHDEKSIMSDILEVGLEFYSIAGLIVLKIFSDIYFNYKIDLVSNYHILFFTFSYIFVHNINYSIFHVNNVHEYHHIDVKKNLGPDFFDILFKTKHDPENNLENTDHYISSILLSLFLIIIIKYIESKISDKDFLTNILFISYFLLAFFLLISTLHIFLKDISFFLEKKLCKFIK